MKTFLLTALAIAALAFSAAAESKGKSITLSGKGVEPGSRFTTSAGLIPRLKRKRAMSPTTLLEGVTFTMSPKSAFTSA